MPTTVPAAAANDGSATSQSSTVELAERTTDPSAFELLMNVVITETRRDPNAVGRHRFSRFDTFMYTLQSYAPLPLDRVFLFVELDLPDSETCWGQLERNATRLFGARLVTLQRRRLVNQPAWRHAWHTWIAPPSIDPADDASRLIFFTNNDDHPFVDFNQDVLREGLARLRADTQHRFKTLFMSHWPEALHLVGKVERPKLHGSYVSASITQVESLQIFNIAYLRLVLLELDWSSPDEGGAAALTHSDRILKMRSIYGAHSGPRGDLPVPHFFSQFVTRDALQVMYVPLRELCRKFDAYAHVGVSHERVPQLQLPAESNGPGTTLPRSAAHIRAVLRSPMRSRWTELPNYYHELPQSWVNRSVALYTRPSTISGGAGEWPAATREHPTAMEVVLAEDAVPQTDITTAPAERNGGMLYDPRRHWSGVGYCAVVLLDTDAHPSDCDTASAGSWKASKHGMTDVDACVRQCATCTRCNFISFSQHEDDCSWYESCSLPLQKSFTFLTVQVMRERESPNNTLPVWRVAASKR